MDKSAAASNAVKLVNLAKQDLSARPDMIKVVCAYFDMMKATKLSHADRLFMHYLANQAGLPQYYDPMLRIGSEVDANLGLQTLSNYMNESSLVAGEGVMLHRYQKEVLDFFKKDKTNRFFLSASTSFGKTFLIYEIIRKMQYANIILIFPTIALMSENLSKIYTEPKYAWIKDQYKIHTLSDIDEYGQQNIFIYTPERYLSYMDKNAEGRPHIDFVFVDEAYKIDNSFVIDEEEQENERDVTYRVALYYLLQDVGIDCLLAAPYVENLVAQRQRANDSFGLFLTLQNISVLDYNKYEIVGKSECSLTQGRKIAVNDEFELNYEANTGKAYRLISTVSQLVARNENVIVYAYSRTSAESYAKKMIDSGAFTDIDTKPFAEFLSHLNTSMNGQGINWVVSRALRKGIGVHHGLVPKYIQNEIIKLFNLHVLHTLICTTTITEGVNTTAKNIIILSHKKGDKILKKFDAKNIEGRAGRFLQHYQGRVFILDNKFSSILQLPDESMHHKFYDTGAKKNDVDLMFITDHQFLNQDDVRRKAEIDAMLVEQPLNQAILDAFTTISVADKMTLYQAMVNLPDKERRRINNFVLQFHNSRFYDTQCFDSICTLIRPIVHNNDLAFTIDYKVNEGVCLLAIQIYYYLRQGLQGCIAYRLSKKPIDEAVQESTKLVYNTLKYQAVKYLGLFNLIYKTLQMESKGVLYEDTLGIDYLLYRLEFNANTLQGRMVSDLGAPQQVVDYFDALATSKRKANVYLAGMDKYEKSLTHSIMEIIRNGNE